MLVHKSHGGLVDSKVGWSLSNSVLMVGEHGPRKLLLKPTFYEALNIMLSYSCGSLNVNSLNSQKSLESGFCCWPVSG